LEVSAKHDLQEWRSEEARSLGVVFALTELIKPLSNCLGLSEAQQNDFIEKIDTPDLPPNDIHISLGDPFILLRNIDIRSGLAKGRRCRAVQMENRTVFFQFGDNETPTLTRIHMEKSLNGMKFLRCQLSLRLIFAGAVHRSQGMTLQRAAIDCRTKFWEHGQLYAALPTVRNPADLFILLPHDIDDFTIRRPVDPNVGKIVDSIIYPGDPQIPTRLAIGDIQPDLFSIGGSDTTFSQELPCPDDYLDALEDEINSTPCSKARLQNQSIHSLLRYPSTS
jgi:hypothetical protein